MDNTEEIIMKVTVGIWADKELKGWPIIDPRLLAAELEKKEARIKELENQIHLARLLWCDSERDPETGMVHIEYVDEFERKTTPEAQREESK